MCTCPSTALYQKKPSLPAAQEFASPQLVLLPTTLCCGDARLRSTRFCGASGACMKDQGTAISTPFQARGPFYVIGEYLQHVWKPNMEQNTNCRLEANPPKSSARHVWNGAWRKAKNETCPHTCGRFLLLTHVLASTLCSVQFSSRPWPQRCTCSGEDTHAIPMVHEQTS